MYSARDVDVALLIVRAVFGLLLVWHGYTKLRSRERKQLIASMFEKYGLSPGLVHVYAAAVGLMVCGMCLVLGLFVAIAAAGVISLMGVAWWTVRRGKGALAVEGGWELTLIYSAIGLVLALVGPGAWSADSALGMELHGPLEAALASSLGVLGAGAFVRVFWHPAAGPVVQMEK
jgi:putative oxidoreductase